MLADRTACEHRNAADLVTCENTDDMTARLKMKQVHT